MTAPYSVDLRERALARKEAGETNREIAAALLYNPANGLLQVTNGSSQVATLDFQNSTLGSGSFNPVASDGSGGIKITHT